MTTVTTYRMTETETQCWESTDARERDSARREIRSRVRGMGHGRHEIHSYDGIVMDVVEGDAA